jgi:hypothetical protein
VVASVGHAADNLLKVSFAVGRVLAGRALENVGNVAKAEAAPPHASLLAALGRDSPIVKHYSSTKNSCFVTCVNCALCSES